VQTNYPIFIIVSKTRKIPVFSVNYIAENE